MTPNKYMESALTTEASQEEILNRLKSVDPRDQLVAVRFNNALTGLTDEVGELSSIKKKWIEYGGEFPDRTHVLEECGDCVWRLCQLLRAFDLTLEQAMEANLRKLSGHKDSRYNDGFSNEKALNRNTEAEKRRLQAEDDGVNYDQ